MGGPGHTIEEIVVKLPSIHAVNARACGRVIVYRVVFARVYAWRIIISAKM